jgi:hypothetical protein
MRKAPAYSRGQEMWDPFVEDLSNLVAQDGADRLLDRRQPSVQCCRKVVSALCARSQRGGRIAVRCNGCGSGLEQPRRLAVLVCFCGGVWLWLWVWVWVWVDV